MALVYQNAELTLLVALPAIELACTQTLSAFRGRHAGSVIVTRRVVTRTRHCSKAEEVDAYSTMLSSRSWLRQLMYVYKIRNDNIRGSTKVRDISKKVQERRVRWYGHVMRRDDEYVGKRVMGREVQGSRKRGRPYKRWADCVKDDLREKGLSGEVYDRAAWRRLSSHLDPT